MKTKVQKLLDKASFYKARAIKICRHKKEYVFYAESIPNWPTQPMKRIAIHWLCPSCGRIRKYKEKI